MKWRCVWRPQTAAAATKVTAIDAEAGQGRGDAGLGGTGS